MSFSIIVDEERMQIFCGQFASALPMGSLIYLIGDLGAGKTSFVKYCLQNYGIVDNIKSPTYQIVETYQLKDQFFHHFDLYRLNSPLELEDIGLREYIDLESIVFIEWPEKGHGILPSADVNIHFSYSDQKRLIKLEAISPKGQHILKCLKDF